MTRSLMGRIALIVIGVIVWGYGYRYDVPNARLIAIAILTVALVLRFVPGRYLGDSETPRE